MIRIALAGNPNSGKTTLFNSLTGSTAHVGNWPGVTVDKRDGVYKKGKEPMQIIDLPGIYSLSPYTPEEVISRNYILDEKPDCIINIVDATNLERNLYLTTQLMEIDVPMVIALNMIDAVKKNGDKIDAKTLEKKIGIKVVEISALRETGLTELMEACEEAYKTPREGTTVLESTDLNHLIEDVRIALKYKGIDSPLFHAIKLVEKDEIEVHEHEDTVKMIDEFKATFKNDVFGDDFEALVADARYRYISKHYSSALTRHKKNDNLTRSDKVDKVLTHKFWGIPFFLLIMFVVYHLTFSENFLFIGAALNGQVTLPDTVWEGLVLNGHGVNAPGVFFQKVMEGITGLIDTALRGALESSPAWVTGLLCDGVWAGISAVLSFIPQIMVLFLFLSILEDSGYMARVAFILDRLFRKFGLSGRAFMPMIMGFGCSVPAMINTRTLADEKEKVATIRVIPFFSCGAKLPILTAIAGVLVSRFGLPSADLITYGMYLGGILVAIASVLLMRNTTLKGETPPFIMELPAYHLPQPKNLALHLWDKVKHYLKKAFTVILATMIIIWFLSNFTWQWQMVPNIVDPVTGELVPNIGMSILANIGQFFTPLFTPLGFGSQLNAEYSWVFVVSAVTGLIAKENVIATFSAIAAILPSSILASSNGSAVLAMVAATGVTPQALVAFIIFNMTTIPCFATVATAKGELTKKQFRSTIVFWILTSYIVGSMVYLVGTWPWTVAIFIAVAVLVAVLIHLNNIGKINLSKLKIKRRKRQVED